MPLLNGGPRPRSQAAIGVRAAAALRSPASFARLAASLAIVIGAAGCGRTPIAATRVAADAWPDPYREPTATLMWPGTTRAIRVLPSGALDAGAWTLTLDASTDGRAAEPPRRIAFEDRWLPVAYWSRPAGDLRWEFEAVPGPWPRSPLETFRDAMMPPIEPLHAGDGAANAATPRATGPLLLVRARRRVAAAAAEARPLAVSLRVRVTNVGARPRLATLRAEPGAATAPGAAGSAVLAAASPRDVRAFVSGVTLSPGESRELRWAVVTHPVSASRLRAWLGTPHERRAAECRAFWTREVARGAVFDLGDADLDRAIRAARVTLLSLRERRDGGWVALGGPFEGRDPRPEESARTMRALAVHRYVGEARALAAGLLAGQSPQGAFTGAGDPRASTAQTLWAFEQVLLRPAPARDLRTYAEAADRAWRWNERVRDVRATGRRRAAARPSSATELWALAGERAAARLLDAAGMAAHATEALAARERRRRAFESASSRAGEAGAGAASDDVARATTGGALPADHARVRELIRRYGRARRDGVPSDAATARVPVVAVAAVAAQALRAGRSGRADSVLAALVRWTNASGAAAAVFDPGTGATDASPPRSAPAAALLTLVRDAVIEDDGDRLELTLGVRRSWWVRGGSLRRAPTRWGELTLAFDWRGDVAHWRWTPVTVWTALTLPPGTRLAAAPPAPMIGEAGGFRVMVPPGIGDARVRVREVIPAPRVTRRPRATRPPVRPEGPDTIDAPAPPRARVAAPVGAPVTLPAGPVPGAPADTATTPPDGPEPGLEPGPESDRHE